MALVLQVCWTIPLPWPYNIGELVAGEFERSTSLSIGPDRHYSLDGRNTPGHGSMQCNCVDYGYCDISVIINWEFVASTVSVTRQNF